MKIYNHIQNIIKRKGAAHLILLDPDKLKDEKLISFVKHCDKSGVDGFLLGGSLMMNGEFEEFIKLVKSATELPAIIFPGGVNQVSKFADAILFLSVISGRNPEHLIGKHVLSAPLIKQANLEAISTGYIIVESGKTTTAQYMSGSQPIPRNKPEIAAATALAAEYLGMKMIYLEAGSGAEQSVPLEMIETVSNYISIPLIVGGGIKNPELARQMVKKGAKVIVTGNFFENDNNWKYVKDFVNAVHVNDPIEV